MALEFEDVKIHTVPMVYVITCTVTDYSDVGDVPNYRGHVACAFIDEREAERCAASIRYLHNAITEMKPSDERQFTVATLRMLDSAYDPSPTFDYAWAVEGAPMPIERMVGGNEPRTVPQPTGTRAMQV